MRPRRIAVVTGTRAEYGLLKPVLDLIAKDRSLRLQLIVTGSHLDPRFGSTVREIAHPIAARLPLPLAGDGSAATAAAMGAAVTAFGKAYAKLKPDVLVVLGDRYEILAAAAAALPFRLPVAHIHGGESSEGVWDESVRHAVTKLSHLHFAAEAPYARRIVRMGEDRRRVYCFGSPGLDAMRGVESASRGELSRRLGLSLDGDFGVATYHPATLSADRGLGECRALLAALKSSGVNWVLTYPNADAGGHGVIALIKKFVRENPGRAAAVTSLGQRGYFGLLRAAAVMAGNSSSGLLEAPYFGLPVVNVGERQKGRLRRANVIDVPKPTARAIERALKRAQSARFRRGLRKSRGLSASPSARIVAILKKVTLDDALLKKSFHG